ncbi:MAG: transcriptional regulator protein [Alphaproteobacteria bacterium]|nr:MAG: transcriptional regulator protein [Alphaproteobacteria bacterium]
MLTVKAKYALRAMLDLAHQAAAESGVRRPVFIADIAQRQDIPRRFLENILVELKRSGLVVSHRGKHGGYALARPPEEITFAEVIRISDGPLALAPCASRTAYKRCDDCPDEATCVLRHILIEVRDSTAAILERTTLASASKLPLDGLTGRASAICP